MFDYHKSMNEEQNKVFHMITNTNNSACICGPGGVGKSYLVDNIVEYMISKKRHIGVVATTGTAAINIKGTTLHSFFNLTPFVTDYEKHANIIKYKRKDTVDKLKNLQTLIIDEISMLDDVLCSGISVILSIVRNNPSPFGGVQMVFVGDFFQLPPVQNNYCFKSLHWQLLEPVMCELKTIVRQMGDTAFIKILQKIRVGKHTKKTIHKLMPLLDTEFPEHIQPTKLYSTNVDVDSINNREMEKLKVDGRECKTYVAKYTNAKNVNINLDVTLCEGAQVMVTKNVDICKRLVNGTRGTVVKVSKNVVTIRTVNGDIEDIEFFTEVLDQEKNVKATFMPLRLAYALTIHKSQGATLDCMEICLDNKVFTYGQAYTGLSRAKSMNSIKITALNMSAFKTSPVVLEYMDRVTKL